MTKKANDRRCETCRHDLGGGYDNCRINLEAECGDGDFEVWEPKETEYDVEEMARILAKAMASTGIMSKEIIGIALSRSVDDLFGDDTEQKGESA